MLEVIVWAGIIIGFFVVAIPLVALAWTIAFKIIDWLLG